MNKIKERETIDMTRINKSKICRRLFLCVYNQRAKTLPKQIKRKQRIERDEKTDFQSQPPISDCDSD